MKRELFVFSILLAVVILGLQHNAHGSEHTTRNLIVPKDVTFQVELSGKIDRMKEMGGYFLYGTPQEFRIANQNPKLLGNLAKSGATVEVEGKVSRNTGFLTIERINGKPYQGSVRPYSEQ